MRNILLLWLTAAIMFAAPTDGMKSGKAPLKSAGPLAFGPEGVLFIGDSVGAQVVALDTADRGPAAAAAPFEVKGLDQKIAAMLGTSANQIMINDAAVNPLSKKIYLSVSRGRGPDAVPMIMRVDAKGQISEVSLDNAKFSEVAIADAPAATKGSRTQNPRM